MEYEAVIYVLRIVYKEGARKIILYTNSNLVVNQFIGTFETRDERMEAYMDVLVSHARQFRSVQITLKMRNENRHADVLAFLSVTLPIEDERELNVKV